MEVRATLNSSQRRRISAWSGGGAVAAHCLIRPLIGTFPNRVIRKDATVRRPAVPARTRTRSRVTAARAREPRAETAIAPCMVIPFIFISSVWKSSLRAIGTALKVGTRLAAP